ncbi:Uncharacterized protein TPAR_08610 [Tolypocladium paradoxum]|uniref:Uncharacterized protein n=1 Tax=Tolypocladium paradoxum TaxID=94208 RepID=A0A2S4KLX9_9HYPO|nr:Uncharacterized protein TPAR_08610 [Tolypocladium paradoxum]
MNLGNVVTANLINGLSVPNQIVLLSQLQQFQTLQQLNLIGPQQVQQVVGVLGQGFASNGGVIAIVGRRDEESHTAVEV